MDAVKPGRSPFLALLVGLALLAVAACQQITPAQIQGILQSVDSISGEVTMKLKDGGTITVNLQDVDVEALRQGVGSASLEPGSSVTIERDQSNTVKKLKAHAAEVEGIITGVDPATKTVTINTEDDEEVTLQVSEATKIEVDEEEAAFAALLVGQEVEAKYDLETKRALKIEIEKAKVEEEEEAGKVKGTITAINTDAKTVTILAENGVSATYTVTPKTKLDFEGAGTFADLKTGLKVEARFDPATKALTRIKAEKAKVETGRVVGTITAINTDAKTVTILAENGVSATYTVTPKTKLDFEGAGTFADLKTGLKVEAIFNPTTKALTQLKGDKGEEKD